MTVRVWLRQRWCRVFPGRWTAAEVAEIQRRADARYQAIQHLVD